MNVHLAMIIIPRQDAISNERNRCVEYSRCDFSHFIIAGFESIFHLTIKGETVMYLQTQPTPVFTVFGSYVLERQGDYFPVRSNGQDRWDTENMESTYALLAAARQQINLQ